MHSGQFIPNHPPKHVITSSNFSNFEFNSADKYFFSDDFGNQL